MTLGRAVAAETIGTALLLAIVVGSGIMGERLAQGNPAIALLANSIATGAGLYTLIIVFGPISGAHFNPVVSAVNVWEGRLSTRRCAVYVLAQVVGAFAGVVAAHAMFGLSIFQISAHIRPTLGEGLGEIIATKSGTLRGEIPAKVSVSARASVTAGLAKEVDEVNQ